MAKKKARNCVDQLLHAIAKSGLNNADLGRKSGVGRTTISRIRSGSRSTLKVSTVEALGRALGLRLVFEADDHNRN